MVIQISGVCPNDDFAICQDMECCMPSICLGKEKEKPGELPGRLNGSLVRLNHMTLLDCKECWEMSCKCDPRKDNTVLQVKYPLGFPKRQKEL
jgi:hypothetical protein